MGIEDDVVRTADRLIADTFVQPVGLSAVDIDPLDAPAGVIVRLAMKVSIVRPAPAGSLFDTDLYGAQQHVLRYPIEIP